MDAELIAEIRRLVVDLIAQRYGDIVADGRGGRLTQSELRKTVSDYGHTLVPLPDEVWPLADTYQDKSDPTSSMIDIPLWTAEEGRSDLVLSLSSHKHGDHYDIEIDDIHVL